MTAPWYLSPEVLPVLAQIRDAGELPVENRRTLYVQTADQWQVFAGSLFTRLVNLRRRVIGDDFSPITAGDVVAALTGQRLSGFHFISSEPGLLSLKAEIEEALEARAIRKAAA